MNLHALIKRVADSEVDHLEGRRSLLAALYNAGFESHLAPDEPPGGDLHTLAIISSGQSGGSATTDLFVIPDRELGEIADDLEAVNGLIHQDPLDCSVYQLGSLLRVMSASGQRSARELVAQVQQAHELRRDEDLSALPSSDALQSLHRALVPWRAASLPGKAGTSDALMVALSRAIAVADLVN